MKYIFEAQALIDYIGIDCFVFNDYQEEYDLIMHMIAWYGYSSIRDCLIDYLKDRDLLEDYHNSDAYKNYIKGDNL